MKRGLRLAGKFLVIGALFAGVAWLSDRPVYRTLPEGSAMMLLAFVPGAARKGECRRLSPEDIDRLAPNVGRGQDGPRVRRSLYVELDIDGRRVYSADLKPTGIAGDGPSRVYQRFVMPAGKYDVAVRMRDTARADGFDHERRGTVDFAPSQMFVIDYRPENGEFIFR